MTISQNINNINNNNSASTPSGSNKSRSHSTTSLYNQHPNGKRLMRERKTVCSLHPLSSTTTPNEYSSTGLLLHDNTSNCSGLNDSEALQQQQQLHLRDRDDSENEAFSYSLPGSAVDSRRGSGLSTRYDNDRDKTKSFIIWCDIFFLFDRLALDSLDSLVVISCIRPLRFGRFPSLEREREMKDFRFKDHLKAVINALLHWEKSNGIWKFTHSIRYGLKTNSLTVPRRFEPAWTPSFVI